MRKIFLAIFIFLNVSIIFSQNPCPDKPTVVYQGKTYNTVQIGGQCWLKENLDVGTMIQGNQNQSNNNIIEKYCYDNKTENCATYGGLYQWAEAVQYKNGATNISSPNPGFSGNIQGICPTGWHIPTQDDFKSLGTFVGGSGNALKAIGQGVQQGKGTNTSGFTALLTGDLRTGGVFNYLGQRTDYICLDENKVGQNINSIYTPTLDDTQNNIYYNNNPLKTFGLSVRCLLDNSGSIIFNYPKGGEQFVSGQTYNITWSSSGALNVKIEYSTNNGSDWLLINGSIVSNLGTYSWIVPSTYSTQCKIKITSLENPSVYSISNNTFSIFSESSPRLTIISVPTYGGTVSGGGLQISGSSATLKAVPSSGYTFKNWTENGVILSTSSTYIFTITGNRNISANFIPTWDPDGSDYKTVENANVAVILIDFPDTKEELRAQYPSVETIRKEIFDSGSIIQKYFKTMSYGKFKFTGDVFGPFTHQDPITVDNNYQANAYLTIKTINIPDFQFSKYTHFVFIAYNDYINWGGCAFGKDQATVVINNANYLLPEHLRMAIQIGNPYRNIANNFFNSFTEPFPFQVPMSKEENPNRWLYLNNYSGITFFSMGLIHEFIHTLYIFGGHANSRTNGNKYPFEPEVANNSSSVSGNSFLNKEYGNNYDIMGDAVFSFSLNGGYRDLLGWTDTNNKIKINSYTKQRVRLYPINRNSGTRICEIRVPFKYSPTYGGKNMGYFLEVREVDKWDSTLVDLSVNKSTKGIMVLETDGIKTFLLDACPSPNVDAYGMYPDIRDVALKPGMRYTDGDVYLSKVEAHTDGSFSVDVEILDPKITPSKTSLYLPLVSTSSVTLNWYETPHTVNYIVQLSKDQLFSAIAKSDSVTIDTTMTITGLEENTKYYWRIRGKNLAGYGEWSAVSIFTTQTVGVDKAKDIPTEYLLSQNFPNPFNPVTKIRFGLPENAFTKLIIYDILGREVETLVDKELEAGSYEFNFNGNYFSSGIYLYRILAGGFTSVKKMLLMK